MLLPPCPEAITSHGTTRACRAPVAPRRGRILYVCGTPLVPSKVGPARRNYHIVDQLSRFFDIAVIAFGEPRDVAVLRTALRAPIQRVIFLPQRPRFKYVRKLWHTVRGRCDHLPA